jgi:drug/metabolite transporter (DMT)-like permease
MISYVLAFASAAANATGNVLNRKASRDEPEKAEFRLRLIADLLRRPAWLSAVGLMILSFVLVAAALGTGTLASVQIMIIVELPMTLIGGAWALGGRLSRREWLAVSTLTAGVIAILALADPQAGSAASRIPAIAWIIGTAANVGAVVVLFLLARATTASPARAALLGVAAGLSYSLTAAFTKGMTQQFSSAGVAGVLSSWQLYALVSAGLMSVWLLQNAYRAGTLAAAQPGITLVDPLVSTTWGVVVFGEQVRHGPVVLLAIVPLVAVIAGAATLARSPVLQDATEEGERRGRGHRSAAHV